MKTIAARLGTHVHSVRTLTVNAALALGLLVAAAPLSAQTLRFAPPALENPITLEVSPEGTEIQRFSIPDDRDAILQFPATIVEHPVIVRGGRRIVAIGGHIRHSGPYTRALAFTRMPAGSIVYLEGLIVDVSAAPNSDGINADGKTHLSPDVYIQNCVITGIGGTQSGFHGDGFQFTGTTNELFGRGYLYMSHCDIDTSYQGAIVAKHSYHNHDYTHTSRFENMYFTHNSTSPHDGRLAYIFWTASGSDLRRCNYIAMENVWMNEHSAIGMTVRANHFFPGPTFNVDHGDHVTSDHPFVEGKVLKGRPTGGSMVIGNPGANYTPVGYRYASSQQAYGLDYWKSQGPLVRGGNRNPWPTLDLRLGSVTYTMDEVAAILHQPSNGNGLIWLAQHLIAAKLNVASGAATPTMFSDAINAADQRIGFTVIDPYSPGSLSGEAVADLLALLEAFNEGKPVAARHLIPMGPGADGN